MFEDAEIYRDKKWNRTKEEALQKLRETIPFVEKVTYNRVENYCDGFPSAKYIADNFGSWTNMKRLAFGEDVGIGYKGKPKFCIDCGIQRCRFDNNLDECEYYEGGINLNQIDNNIEKLRGHEIKFNGEEYVYLDNEEPTQKGFFIRPCGECGRQRTEEGHDACLGTLPGIMNACCGHGDVESAYIQFLDGFSINGKEAIVILNILKKHRR